ncbi:MAG TPA: DUF4129 domain-containing protein, partial [Flammeovirgaceae bacterium]|nr:DUF4129 domain-containing protein [Flammeovirgaceae bacterium]
AAYKQNKAFDYSREIVPWENPLFGWLGYVFRFVAWMFNSLLGYVVLALLLIGLVYVIYRYTAFTGERELAGQQSLRLVNEERVEEVDFQRLLALALEKQDYRLAIRYVFLDVLKSLSLRKLIKLSEGKTNYDYYYEMPPASRPPFRQVLQVFEYVWYGEFPASEALYRQVNAARQQLQSTLPQKGGVANG